MIVRKLVLRLLNALADQKERRASRRFHWQCDPIALSAMGAILLYRRVAPNDIRSRCRFVPTCSEYGLLALKNFTFERPSASARHESVVAWASVGSVSTGLRTTIAFPSAVREASRANRRLRRLACTQPGFTLRSGDYGRR